MSRLMNAARIVDSFDWLIECLVLCTSTTSSTINRQANRPIHTTANWAISCYQAFGKCLDATIAWYWVIDHWVSRSDWLVWTKRLIDWVRSSYWSIVDWQAMICTKNNYPPEIGGMTAISSFSSISRVESHLSYSMLTAIIIELTNSLRPG